MTSDKQQKNGSASRRRSRRGRPMSPEEAARRHQGRMLALQVLYEVDLTAHDPEEALARAFAELEKELDAELEKKLEIEAAKEPAPERAAAVAASLDAEFERITAGSMEQINSLVHGVLANRDALDPLIAAAAPARSLHEQAAIERNVLRLAAYELLHEPDVPPKVAINEAVELAKQFGGENSGKFVNGVLRTLYEQSPRAAPAPAGEDR